MTAHLWLTERAENAIEPTNAVFICLQKSISRIINRWHYHILYECGNLNDNSRNRQAISMRKICSILCEDMSAIPLLDSYIQSLMRLQGQRL